MSNQTIWGAGVIEPEYVKLIPVNSIPVFCLSPEVLDCDMHRIREELKHFFGDRKFLVIRSGDVQIYAIADQLSISTEGSAWAMEEKQ